MILDEREKINYRFHRNERRKRWDCRAFFESSNDRGIKINNIYLQMGGDV